MRQICGQNTVWANWIKTPWLEGRSICGQTGEIAEKVRREEMCVWTCEGEKDNMKMCERGISVGKSEGMTVFACFCRKEV